MKDKILYLIGMIVMPIGFVVCIPFAIISGLVEASRDVAFDIKRNWRTLIEFYLDGFPRRSNKERP